MHSQAQTHKDLERVAALRVQLMAQNAAYGMLLGLTAAQERMLAEMEAGIYRRALDERRRDLERAQG